MTPKRWAIAGGAVLAALLVAFLAGRRSAPVQTVERAKTTEEIEKEQKAITEAVARARSEWEKTITDHTVTKVITRYLAGKPIETVKTVYVDRDSQARGSMDASVVTSTVIEVRERVERVTEATKTVETVRPDWAVDVAALWGRNPTPRPDRLSVALDRRILGPLWLGATAHVDLSSKPGPRFGAVARVEW